jgi:hypothetical protein
MPPPLPSSAVFDPTFRTAIGNVEAGTAFAVQVSDRDPLVVTCQHLFGPAGGISKEVPPAFMPRFVLGVGLKGALGLPVAGQAGAALALPKTNATDPNRDVAAFPLVRNPQIRPLQLVADDVKEGARVYLAARLRAGNTGAFLHPARLLGPAVDGTLPIVFEDASTHMPGTSGAPVLTESGALVGMVVRFRASENLTAAYLLSAATLAESLGA